MGHFLQHNDSSWTLCRLLSKGKQSRTLWVQKGWSKQQFLPLAFFSCSGELATTCFIRTVESGYKVALEILHHEQSLQEWAFPRRNLGRDKGRAWL